MQYFALVFFIFGAKKQRKVKSCNSLPLSYYRELHPITQPKEILSNLEFSLWVIYFPIALARPQWGTERRTNQPTGIDLFIALDVSKSMWARDVKPNRLERVKLSISNLIGNVKGDRHWAH